MDILKLLKENNDKLFCREVGVECEPSTIIFINFLLVYENKYYLSVNLGKCAYKVVNMQMNNYLDENIFECDQN